MLSASDNPDRQRQFTTIAVVVFGMIVAMSDTFGADTPAITSLELAFVLLLGLIYLLLELNEGRLIPEDVGWQRKSAYFLVQLAIILTIQLLLENPGGIWLLGMPLIGSAVGHFRLPGIILVAAAYLAIIAVPTGLIHGWQPAFSVTVSITPAIIFVALFVRLWMTSEQAREEVQELADQLEAANRQLSSYATQAEELAISNERNRLAREIHDSLGHYLTVINVQAEAAKVVLDDDPERARQAMDKAQNLAQEGLASVRRSVAALRESPLGSRSLPEAIGDLVQELGSGGIVAEFEVHGKRRLVGTNTALTLYRAAQEGLTNVRKHARASRVDLALTYSNDETIRLTIADNGVGTAAQDGPAAPGFGLLGIRERVQILDGSFEMESRPGKGFRLTITVPS